MFPEPMIKYCISSSSHRLKPKIDILVNCAGVSQSSLLVRMEKSDVDNILNTNLHGAIYGCRHVGRKMISHHLPGCIINVSSLLSRKGTIGTSVYAASKAGLVGMFRSLIFPGQHVSNHVTDALQTQQGLQHHWHLNMASTRLGSMLSCQAIS